MRHAPSIQSLVGVLAGLATFTGASLAQAQAPAHEHGVAELKVSVDARTVLIEFETPLDNVVGFEQAPNTAAQKESLRQAEALLRRGESLYALPPAALCRLHEVQLEMPFSASETTHDEHHHHDHGSDHDHQAHHAHHAHEAEHAHHAHHAHAHAHAQHEEGHVDVYAVYEFECEQPEHLNGVNVSLFEHFQRLQLLRAKHATAAGQGAVDLTRERVNMAW